MSSNGEPPAAAAPKPPDEGRAGYRQIVKATSLFGGVQVFLIVLAIVRTKAVAVLLGPAGMGTASLYASTLALIGSLTGLGLQVSAVKDIAAAHASGDTTRMGRVVAVTRRLVWGTGALGVLVVAVGAPWLSRRAFADDAHTGGFLLLSLTLLFGALTAQRLVQLQGTRQLGRLARVNMAGGVLGLASALPMYWLWGEDGIVPALMATSFSALLVATVVGRAEPLPTPRLTLVETLAEGRSMLGVGFAIMLNGVLLGVSDYIIRLYISSKGGTADVGLYAAALGLMTNYVGMVFNAMSTDYFPRLAGVAEQPKERSALVNQQAEIAILVLAPILATLVVFVQPAIWLLYSERFLPVAPLLQWTAVGVLLKAASWPVGFLLVARGDNRLFVASELAVNTAMVLCSVGGYLLLGFEGLGIGYVAAYALYWLQLLVIGHLRYDFHFGTVFLRLFAIQAALVLGCLALMRVVPAPWSYVAASVLVAVSVVHAVRELDRRIGVASLVAKVRQRLGRRGGPEAP